MKSSAPLTAAINAVRRNPLPWICMLALAASLTSLMNGFALDDVAVIAENDRVHSLTRVWQIFGESYWPASFGSSLYRPLTMLAFSIQWAIGNGSPLPFHVTSIALYVLACVTLFRFLKQIVDADVAGLAAALFAVHPVHTEAVANIVGQGELLVAIFIFLAMERYIRARQLGGPTLRDALVIGLCYAGGLMSKEHMVVLPALLVSAELLIAANGETVIARAKRFVPTLIVLVVVAAAFIVARTIVTGDLQAAGTNEILAGTPFTVRALTMLNVVLEWIRLFFWPAQLSADYSYPRTHVATSPELTMIPGAIVIAGCAALAWGMRRSKPIITFAILWIAITMAIPSNLLMVTGFVLAERTLFLSSAGIVLIVAVAASEAWRMMGAAEAVPRRVLVIATGLLLVFGVARSTTRNPAWRDNDTLFRQTVEDVPFSSRAHLMLAQHLSLTKHSRDVLEEVMLAMALGRKDDVLLLGVAADQFHLSGMCGRAIPIYRRALALTPRNEQLRANTALCLMRLGRIDEAREIAMSGFQINRTSPVLIRSVALADSLTRVAHDRTLRIAR